MIIVCDSSVLIALQNIGKLYLLEKLFGGVVVPKAVKEEVFGKENPPGWIQTKELSQPLASLVLGGDLEAGESEAICLYEELKADLLIMDDLMARGIADRLRIKCTGTLGILLLAKGKKLIKEPKPLLEDLQRTGFHMSEDLVANVLDLAG